MPVVTFIHSDGETQTYVGQVGETVLDVALDNGVKGILGQCGGGCTCCTCHCWVQSPSMVVLGHQHPDEVDMLEYAWQRASNSRLACQVKLMKDIDIVVGVPAQQS